MSKHTPGPWEASDWRVCAHVDGPIEVVCDTGWNARTRTDERRANARLIAASPTMFAYIEKRAAEGDQEASQILESINAESK